MFTLANLDKCLVKGMVNERSTIYRLHYNLSQAHKFLDKRMVNERSNDLLIAL